MDFNRFKKIIFCVTFVSVLQSCGPRVSDQQENPNLIGEEMAAIAPLRASDGTQKNKISFYDPLLKKIHQFDLNPLALSRTLSVLFPDEKHYVIDSGQSDYIVDLSLKHISIFNRYSAAQHHPIRFQGNPISAAFRPDLGWLVTYDDLQSVGVINLSNDGQVQKSHVFGSVVSADNSIVSGDLMNDGQLLLALSDNSLALVDLNLSLNSIPKKWNASFQTTTLTKINWIAPLPNVANRVLIKTSDQIVLYDYILHSLIEKIDLTSDQHVMKLSKTFDPHVLLSTGPRSMKLVYTDGTRLITRDFELKDEIKPILTSDLDISNDTWTFVNTTNNYESSFFNDPNQYIEQRQLIRYQISDKLVLQNKSIDNKAQIKLGVDYFFVLFPSVLGKVQVHSVMQENVETLERFNLKKY